MLWVKNSDEGRKVTLENTHKEDLVRLAAQSIKIFVFVDNVGYNNWDDPVYRHYEQTFQKNPPLSICFGKILFVLTYSS